MENKCKQSETSQLILDAHVYWLTASLHKTGKPSVSKLHNASTWLPAQLPFKNFLPYFQKTGLKIIALSSSTIYVCFIIHIVKFPEVFLHTAINLLPHVYRSLNWSSQYRLNCLLQGSIPSPKFIITDSLTTPFHFSHFPSLFFLRVWFSLFCCILRLLQGFKYLGCTKTIWRNQESFSTLKAEPNSANSA